MVGVVGGAEGVDLVVGEEREDESGWDLDQGIQREEEEKEEKVEECSAFGRLGGGSV